MPKRLTSLGIFGSGGTLPALFTEDYIYRPQLTEHPVRSRNIFYLHLLIQQLMTATAHCSHSLIEPYRCLLHKTPIQHTIIS